MQAKQGKSVYFLIERSIEDVRTKSVRQTDGKHFVSTKLELYDPICKEYNSFSLLLTKEDTTTRGVISLFFF